MDKSTFAKCMKPAVSYYGKDLDSEAMQIYYEELAGYTIPQLENAVRGHIANSKFFPKIPDLRKRIIGTEEVVKPKESNYPKEYARHREATDRLFEALIDGHEYETEGTFMYPLENVAEAARSVYEHYLNETSEASARSYAYSAIHLWTMEYTARGALH